MSLAIDISQNTVMHIAAANSVSPGLYLRPSYSRKPLSMVLGDNLEYSRGRQSTPAKVDMVASPLVQMASPSPPGPGRQGYLFRKFG